MRLNQIHSTPPVQEGSLRPSSILNLMSGGSSDADQHASSVQSPLGGDSLGPDNVKHQEAVTSSSPSETVHSSSQRENSRGNGSLERIPTAQGELPDTVQAERTATDPGPMHSVFTRNQKLFIVFMASWAGFFSPVSGQIYFPALNALAKDLHVSNSLINLTLTSYMVCSTLFRT